MAGKETKSTVYVALLKSINAERFDLVISRLTVRLGDALDLVLLLDGVRVTRSTGGVDKLLGEALGHGLEVAEAGLARAGGEEVEGVVDAAEGTHVHGLATDDSGSSDTGGVLARSGVDDGIDDDLDGVLVGEEVDDLEGVLDDADGHELLARVASLAHEAARQTLDDGAGGLAEALLLVTPGSVGKVGGVVALDGDVVDEGDITDLDIVEGPLAEELDLSGPADGDELLLFLLGLDLGLLALDGDFRLLSVRHDANWL